MLKKAPVGIMIILSLIGFSVLAFEMKERTISGTSGKVWYVGPPPSDFATIQEAVYNESVMEGDTLEVKWMITPYNESVFVNKTLTIRHYSYDHPGDFPTVYDFQVDAPNVEINGFIVGQIFLSSSNNRILNNSENVLQIWQQSCNNTLRQNIISDGFDIDISNETGHFVQDIDTSNTFNGRPIYYLFNQSDRKIPTDAGFVAIVNSVNITATDLTPEPSLQSLLVVDSIRVTIANLSAARAVNNGVVVLNSSKITVQDLKCQGNMNFLDKCVFFSDVNDSQVKNVFIGTSLGNFAISLCRCQNNTIEHNTLPCFFISSIFLQDSDGNIILGNSIEGDISQAGGAGIVMSGSVDNTLIGNSIAGTLYALAFEGSNNSLVFHNNFLGNQEQVKTYGTNVNNAFDNGLEGNFWSDYDFTGQDPDGDGIGTAAYTCPQATDRCPLMVPWSENRTYERPMGKKPSESKWIQKLYTFSNSTLGLPPLGFTFNRTLPEIGLKVTCGYSGFLNITIPRKWIDGQFILVLDAVPINFTFVQNATFSTFYITFAVGRHTLKIQGVEPGNIIGDLNGDNAVDIYDAIILASNYETTG